MADKDLARVDFTIGGKLDEKSIDKAVKKGVDKVVAQTAKIPITLQVSGGGGGSGNKGSSGALNKAEKALLDAIHQRAIAEGKAAQLAAKSAIKAGLKDANINTGNRQVILQAEKDYINAQKQSADAIHARAVAEGKLAVAAAKVAQKAGLLDANVNATNQANLLKAEQQLADAIHARAVSEGKQAIAAAKSAQRAGLLDANINESNKAVLIQAEKDLIESTNERAIQEGKLAVKAAESASKAGNKAVAAQNKLDKAQQELSDAIQARAVLEGKAAQKGANEALKVGDAILTEQRKTLEAIHERAVAEGKLAQKSAAGALKVGDGILKEQRATLEAIHERAIAEGKSAVAAAKSAQKAGKFASDAADKATQQKILDTQKELFNSQQERINEVRKAIALQRIQNKSLEKQGRTASPVAEQSSVSSTSNLSDGLKRAAQSVAGLGKSLANSSLDAALFAKNVIGAAQEQSRLKGILADQNNKLDRTRSLIPKVQALYSDTVAELQKQRGIVVETAKKIQDTNKVLDSTKTDIRAVNVNLSKAAVAAGAFEQELRDKFGSLKRAGDVAEFKFSRGDIDGFRKISKLVTAASVENEKFNKLTTEKVFLEKQQVELLARAKKQGQEQVDAFTRGKELENKKTRLQQEATGLLNKLNVINAERARIAEQIKAREARGLIGRAIDFVSGGGRGGSGEGNGGAPPSSPGGNNRGGSGGGGGKDNQFKNAAAGINAFNTGMARSLTFLEKIRLNLNEADKAALQFGQSARFSTDRLLAFAAPSALIFKLSSAIRTASQDLIQLDTQARRLVFFEEAGRSGGLAKFNKDINDSSKRSKLLGDAFKNIADEANRTGLAMNIVTEAAQTVARIGEISFLPTGASSDFLKATLGLTQIEVGALNSERAAEILKATLAQFGLEATQVTAVAAKFATVANETSVNVEQLATLVTRFGSAAINVQNLNFDQTLALASISAKTLGTNTFRTATALRQLTTKLVDNIDKIKELSGVEIQVGEGGQLRGIESLLEVLEKVNQLGQTGTGVELAKLIGDRENLSDIFALAKVVPELRGSIAKLADTQNVAAQTSQQIAAFLNVVGLQSDSVESSINRLNTSFAQFLNSAGTTSILDGIVKSLTSLVKLATDVSTSIGGLGGVISALGPIAAVAFGSIAKKGILSLVGFINGPESKAQFKKSIEELLNTPAKRKETIELLNKQGLVNIEAGNRFLQIQNTLEAQKLAIEKQIQSIKVIINNEEKNTIQDLKKIENLERNRLALEKQLENSIRRQQASTKDLLNQNLTGFALLKKQFTENAGGLISGGLATSGAVISQLIPSFIDNPETQQKVESSVIKVFSSAALGAQVGSIFGPKGAVGGAIIGGLIGTVQQGADKIAEILAKNFRFRGGPDENQEELDAEGRQQKRAITVIRANIAARDFAIKQAERQAEATESAIRAEERLNSLRTINTDIVSIEAKINEFRSKGFNIADLLLRLQVKVAERRTLELQTSKDIVNEEARRLKVLEKISALELQQETRSTLRDIEKNTAQQLNKINRGGELTSLQIGIEFDRKQVQDKIKSLESLRDIRVVALAETTAEKTDERSRIQKEILDIEKKIVSEKIQANKSIRDEQFAIFEKQEEIIRTTIDGYREAAAALIEANNRVFAQNKQIAGLVIDRNGLADRRAENRSRPSNETPFTGAQRDIKDATESLKRTQNVRDPSLTSNRLFVKDLGGQFEAAAARLKELDGIYKLNQDSLSLEIQTRKTLLEAQQNNFEQQIGFERDNLESRKESAERLISKQQELIAAEVKMIEVIKERAKQEAEFGRNLLESPEEAFQNLKNLDLAQQFLNVDKELNSRGTRQRFDADKSGGLSAQERDTARNSILEDRLSKLLAQSGGRGITQQILEGLKFAGGLATDPFTGVGGALANEELLARLVGGGSVPTKKGETSQLDRQESTIENRRKQLDETFKSMDAIINQQLELEKKVKATETERLSLIQAQVEQLKNVKLNEAFIGAAQAAIRFKETVDGSKPTFDKINEIANKTVTNENVERLLKDLSSASENLNRIASDNGLQGEQIASSLGGTFNEAISNLSESLNSIRVEVLAEVSPINVQLEGTIKQTLDSEQLATALGRELIGTGLEDRVSEIQGIITRLVEISKAQGNKFPPAPPK